MLATGNPGKIREFRALLALHIDLGQWNLLSPCDWPFPLPNAAETGTTFAENALLKARAVADATGIAALADDSGLCVDALGGRPGIYSARWAGDEATDADRNARLLSEMALVPAENRAAHYFCAVALALPTGQTVIAEGRCDGVILAAPRGNSGFGYDPLFFLTERGRTMAELAEEEKNRGSHRARAVAALVPAFHAFLRSPV